MRRYFTTCLSKICREWSIKAYVTSPLLTKQTPDMLDSNVIVNSASMGNTASARRCPDIRSSCTKIVSGIITHKICIVITIIINTVIVTGKVSSRGSSNGVCFAELNHVSFALHMKYERELSSLPTIRA